MKRIILAIIILASVAITYSCNNSSASGFKQSKSDTVQVVGVFEVGAPNGGKSLRFDYMWRVTKDTFAVAKIDSTGDEITQKKKWIRDTIYFAPFLDTVRINAMPKLDTTGKPEMKVVWVPFPKQLIYEVFEKKK